MLDHRRGADTRGHDILTKPVRNCRDECLTAEFFNPRSLVATVLLLCTSTLAASAAQPVHSVPAPRNVPFRGVIELSVDATDFEHRILIVRQSIPVEPGPLTLLYPQWLPGAHSPLGPISAIAGLAITSNGRRVEWTRDPLNVYSFRVQVPKRSTRLDVEFQYLSPANQNQGRIAITPEIIGVQWNTVVLYPAGHYSSQITIAPSLRLPEGWDLGSALDIAGRQANTVQFKPTTLETLLDSPVFAGRYFKRLPLTSTGEPPVHLNIVADSPEELVVSSEQITAHRRFVLEAYQAFGSPHFSQYDFLLSISGNFGGIGLEHHRSSENGVRRGYFKEWDKGEVARSLLPHEFTHSWNGKFRRPADLWTPNFNTPMQNSLLWVYEGMTQYWGQVLAARSRLWSEDLTLGSLAATAATFQEKRQGRAWRNLEDTTNQPIMSSRRPLPWISWQRTEDYYSEGVLLWLDIDTRIRELTRDTRSLDEFARAFFGVGDGSGVPVTYTLSDVVRTLNAVAPYDWQTFLRGRLSENPADKMLAGFARGGWRLAFKDEPSKYSKQIEERDEISEFSYSIGIVIDKDAKLTEVVWESPAFKAGLSTAVTLIAVNGQTYKSGALKQAIRDAKNSMRPIDLLVKELDRYRTVSIEYSGGLRYPHLERVEGTLDRLSEILAPKVRDKAELAEVEATRMSATEEKQ